MINRANVAQAGQKELHRIFLLCHLQLFPIVIASPQGEAL